MMGSRSLTKKNPAVSLEEGGRLRFGQTVSPHNLGADVRECDDACLNEVPCKVQFGFKMLVALGFDGVVGEINGTGVVTLEHNGRGNVASGLFTAANDSGFGGFDAGGNREDAKVNKKTAQVNGFARGVVQTDVFGVARGRGGRLLETARKGYDGGGWVEAKKETAGRVERIGAIGKRGVGIALEADGTVTLAESKAEVESA